LEGNLADARQRCDGAWQRGRLTRQQVEAIREDVENKPGQKLKEEMLDYEPHVPRSVRLELSKFSAKLLDVDEREREKERKSAWFPRYDDAVALLKETVPRSIRALLESAEAARPR
jgi:hypothetical protein